MSIVSACPSAASGLEHIHICLLSVISVFSIHMPPAYMPPAAVRVFSILAYDPLNSLHYHTSSFRTSTRRRTYASSAPQLVGALFNNMNSDRKGTNTIKQQSSNTLNLRAVQLPLIPCRMPAGLPRRRWKHQKHLRQPGQCSGMLWM